MDYENPTDGGTNNTYVVEVTASGWVINGCNYDNGNRSGDYVTDANETPIDITGTLTIAESASSGTSAGTLTAVDPDGDACTFSEDGSW